MKYTNLAKDLELFRGIDTKFLPIFVSEVLMT
jgi:hypothetical protein